MAIALTCLACGAEGSIVPSEATPVVVCGACHRSQPRRLYDAVPRMGAPERRGFAQRFPGIVAGGGAGGAGLLGVVLLVTIGTVSRQAPWMHVMLFAMAMAFVGVGVFALSRPRGLALAANAGTDAFGRQEWGPTQSSSAKQGMAYGVTMLVAGVAVLVLGVFFGALTG